MSLRIIEVTSLPDKERLFAENDFRNVTWVVSDLRSKLALQQLLRDRYGYFEDDMVLRARELWQKLLFRSRPDLKVLSPNFIRGRLQSKLDGSSVNPKTLARYIEELIPILSHPGDLEKMQDWFEQHPESFSQWGDWFIEARKTWDELFAEKIIAPSWQAGFLVNAFNFEQFWDRPLVFDLGCELLAIESELVSRLSFAQEVTVIEPLPMWVQQYPLIKIPYQDLRLKSHELVKLEGKEQSSSPKQEFLRFTTALAEVKEAVARIRQLLEQGALPSQIVILAPDIEEYWPALSAHLKVEGVPCNKSEVGRLLSRPNLMTWRSALRAASRSLETRDLELALFQPWQMPEISFEEFISNYSVLFSEEDLERQAAVHKILDEKFLSSKQFTLDEFLNWSLRYFPLKKGTEDQLSDIKIVVQEMLKDVPEYTEWNLGIWLDYLDRLMAQKEFEILPAHSEGVDCQSIMSGQSGTWRYRLYLGMSEEQLKGGVSSLLKNQEILSIKADTGHLINHPDRRFLEFQTAWLETQAAELSLFSFAETTMTGKVLTPSVFWIRGRLQSGGALEAVDTPQATRWDELQEQIHLGQVDEAELLDLNTQTLVQQIQADLGLTQYQPLGHRFDRSLSPGSIERMSACPFIFAAEKILNLVDPAIVDIDPDAREKGSVLHECLRQISLDPMRFDLAAPEKFEELIKFVDTIYSQTQEQAFDPEFRKISVRHFARIIQRFLVHEKQLRQQFPDLQILMREQDFRLYINPETGVFSTTESPGCFIITGKMDRVDGDGKGQALVIDYKSKNQSYRNADNWIEDLNLQLFYYATAIEFMRPDLKVMGASYYGLQDLSHAGFVREGINSNFFQMKKTWSEDKWKEQQQQATALVKGAVDNLQIGNFPAQPIDEKLCERCQWAEVCRAPHLEY